MNDLAKRLKGVVDMASSLGAGKSSYRWSRWLHLGPGGREGVVTNPEMGYIGTLKLRTRGYIGMTHGSPGIVEIGCERGDLVDSAAD